MKSIKSSCNLENGLKSYIIQKENADNIKKATKISGINKFLRMYYGIVKKKYKELKTW